MFNLFATASILAVAAYADSDLAYDYTTLGADWPTIHDAIWELCDSGKEQSPIDLKMAATKSEEIELSGYDYFDFDGSSSTILADNKGKKMVFPTPANEEASLELLLSTGEKETFTPAQFHFHAPSEHTVDGSHHDLEVHFVHLGATDATFAVVGVFFDVTDGGSEENSFIKSVMEALTTGEEEKEDDRKSNTVKEFFDTVDFSEFWSYPGSFTTPPCTEGVRWSVVKDVQNISAAQLEEFTKYLADDEDFAGGNGNNRAVQPIHDRTVYMSTPEPVDNTENKKDDGATGITTFAAATIAAIAALAF